jgi:CHAP domain
VAGVRPGSLHAAYDSASRAHWATAGFYPSPAASAKVLLGFQDAGSIGVFTEPTGASWKMVGYGSQSLSCSALLPRAVRNTWGFTSHSACGQSREPGRTKHQVVPHAVSAPTIAKVANENVGVGDTPASTDFDFDCNPFASLVGAGATTSGCGTDPKFGVLDENQEWCADFAKWVWEQGGVPDTGVLDAAAASFYQWALDQGQNPEFDSGTPEIGDAIVFYPGSDTAPNASYADHVGLVVGVNSNGTLNLDNGDFSGSSNITVQANDDVSVGSWAASIWGSGEHWIYVSPGVTPARAYAFWQGLGSGYDLWESQGSANGAMGSAVDLGMGALASAPAAGVDGNGATYVYWEGNAPEDDLWEAYWNGSKWVGPYDRGMGPMGSPPSVAVTTSGTAYVFWKGQNGDLYEAQGPADGSLSGPYNRGMGPLGSAPTVGVDSNGATYVYWEGNAPQDDLWEAYWNGSKFVGPYDRGMGPLGSPPSVAVTGNGTAYVFWKGTSPADDLWEAQGSGDGSLSGPYNRGMGPLNSAPSAGVDINGYTYIYWEGGSPKDDLWEAYWNGSKFAGPYDRGDGPLNSQPTVAIYNE